MHRSLAVVLLILGVTACPYGPIPGCDPTVAHAQVYSSVDTLGTVTVGGFRGDTITVLFDLVNTFAVGGFQCRVAFDPNVFTPHAYNRGPRAQRFELFDWNFGVPGVVSFFATSMYPLDSALAPGAGTIAALDFAIDDSATPGIYHLRFEDTDSMSHENALSNAIGDTLVIPIFVERQILVLPVESVGDQRLLPDGFGLAQNYPNPFNGETKITFSLGKPSWVELSIIDLLGRVVAVPYRGAAPAGESSVTWHTRGSDGEETSSGIYFYRLVDSGGKSVTQKMTLLK